MSRHYVRPVADAAQPIQVSLGRKIGANRNGKWNQKFSPHCKLVSIALTTGKQAHPFYWVRPVIVGREGKLMDASWGGTCALLTSNGCSLEFTQRPHG